MELKRKKKEEKEQNSKKKMCYMKDISKKNVFIYIHMHILHPLRSDASVSFEFIFGHVQEKKN